MNCSASLIHIVALFLAGVPALSGDDRVGGPGDLAISEWKSIRSAYEAEQHKIVAIGNGWRAKSSGQNWVTTFDGRGFTTNPDSGGWNWGLDLQSYGWDAVQQVATPRLTTSNGGRLFRDWDENLTEWYINDTRGLEHGFTIASRPGSANAPLTVDLSIRGGLLPIVSPDGRNVAFTDAQGGTALNYNGLTVLDAVGHTVSARWYPAGSTRMRLQVDDATAQYPLTIDPIAQQSYLKASNTGAGDHFGEVVAISGNTVVVGAPFEDSASTGVNGNQNDNSASNAGAAYVFVRTGSTWSQQAYLKASNADPGDNFGCSVAISGDTIVIGAFAEQSNSTAINGNQLDNSLFNAGAAYVFVRSGTTWTQQAYLKASNAWSGDYFGWSVAISGDLVVVGAPNEASNATGVNGNPWDDSSILSGAAYFFGRSGTTWFQQAYLKASNTDSSDHFGRSVAISGTTVVVGAPEEDSSATGVDGNQLDGGAVDSGAAYVFVRLLIGGVWAQQAYLKASNTGAGDLFGSSVAISINTIVVGAYSEDSNATGVNGNQTDNSASNAGAAYVFFRTGSTWSQQAYLKASNTSANDQFGGSVAVFSHAVVVGAVREDSHATGVNGDPTNNSIADSGAAYVFSRAGVFWSQEGYIKASNTDSSDWFGASVGVSADTVVVGASSEGSNAMGVNGNQASNSAPGAGAVYPFHLNETCGTVSYGTGTPGCAGTHTLSVNQCPQIGRDFFAITCDKAPSYSMGLGLISDAQDPTGGDVFGVGVLIHTGIVFATEVLAFDFYSDASGYAETVGTSIPNQPLLVGKSYYASALWAWPTCSLPPNNLSTSRGLAITILAP